MVQLRVLEEWLLVRDIRLSVGPEADVGEAVFAVLKAVAGAQEDVGSGGDPGLGGRRVFTVDIFEVCFVVNRLRVGVRDLVRG